MSHQITDARKRLAYSLHNVVVDAEQLLKAVEKDGGEYLVDAREKLKDQLTNAKNELTLMGEITTDEARNIAKDADQAAHRHPWAVAGIAATLGAVVGLLLSDNIGRR